MLRIKSKDPLLITLSISLYTLLIAAYPSGFRNEYGPHMAQVFRDYSLRIYRRDGLIGMLNLWIAVLFDFFRTVVEEHLQRGIQISKSAFIRLSGRAFAIGAVACTGFMLCIARDVPKYNRYNAHSRIIDLYFEYAILILLPTVLFLWVVGLVGLYLRYKDETNLLGRYSPIMGVIGGMLSLLISLVWAFSIRFSENETAGSIFFFGLLIYCLSLVIFGAASIKERILVRGNMLPILAGSWLPIFLLLGVFEPGATVNGAIPSFIFALSMLSMVGLGIILKPSPQLEAR